MLWKESPRGTSSTLFSLYIRVAPPIGSYYKLEADGVSEQGRMSELQWNKYPTLLIQKRKQYFIHENRSRDALNHHKLCKITIETWKTFWLVVLTFFPNGSLSRIPLRPALISIQL